MAETSLILKWFGATRTTGPNCWCRWMLSCSNWPRRTRLKYQSLVNCVQKGPGMSLRGDDIAFMKRRRTWKVIKRIGIRNSKLECIMAWSGAPLMLGCIIPKNTVRLVNICQRSCWLYTYQLVWADTVHPHFHLHLGFSGGCLEMA